MRARALDEDNESEPNKRAGKSMLRRAFLDWLVEQQFSEQATAMLREDIEAANPLREWFPDEYPAL